MSHARCAGAAYEPGVAPNRTHRSATSRLLRMASFQVSPNVTVGTPDMAHNPTRPAWWLEKA